MRAGALETIPSEATIVKLSEPVYPVAGRYVKAHVEESVRFPYTGSIVAVKLRIAESTSLADTIP